MDALGRAEDIVRAHACARTPTLASGAAQPRPRDPRTRARRAREAARS